MIIIEKGMVIITEQTLKELLAAVEETKKSIEFINEPIPNCDMSPEQYIKEVKKRGTIFVSTPHSNIKFKINLEREKNTQESLGYKTE